MSRPKLLGATGSPFVRKVQIACAIKGIAYDHEPVIPINPSPEYKKKHPLGKIPCWEDGDFTLPDSSCIVAYLEKLKPQPALYPADPQAFGRALWFEEYADTKVVEVTGALFFERVIKRVFFKQPPDEARVKDAIDNKVPEVYGYLETQAPESGDAIVGGRFSIADLAIGSQFVNHRLAGHEVDARRWPKLAAYIDAIHGNPWFKPVIEAEKAQFAPA
jgi:glutathione S-transferase